MADFLEISKTGNRLLVKFNTLAEHPQVQAPEASFDALNDFGYIQPVLGYEYINMYIKGSGEYQLDVNGVQGLPVSTISGVAPTSNIDLFNKLNELLQ
jgi:hypothetical protein